MANKHRARVVTREDFTKAYSLPMWRKPFVTKRIVKCETCVAASLRAPYNRAAFKRMPLEESHFRFSGLRGKDLNLIMNY